MEKQATEGGFESSRICWEELEGLARQQIQRWLQGVLEEEVTLVFGARQGGTAPWEGGCAVGVSEWAWEAAAAFDEQRDDCGEAAPDAGLVGALRKPDAAAVLSEDERGGRVVAAVVPARAVPGRF